MNKVSAINILLDIDYPSDRYSAYFCYLNCVYAHLLNSKLKDLLIYTSLMFNAIEDIEYPSDRYYAYYFCDLCVFTKQQAYISLNLDIFDF